MDQRPSSATSTAGKVLIALAILLFAGAWARVLHTHLTGPSPARYTEFYTADGPIDPPSWPHCHGTRLIVGAQVWQHCDKSEAAPAGFVRFDLNAGRADQVWPVEGSDWQLILGAALGPDGDVLIAGRSYPAARGHETSMLRLRAGGGIEVLDALPHNLLALRVDGAHIEALTARVSHQPMLHRRALSGGDWTTLPLPELPLPQRTQGDAYRFAAVDAAAHGPEGWTLWALIQGADGTTAALWKCPPEGTWTSVSHLENAFSEDQAKGTRLDRSADGATSPYTVHKDLQLWVRQTPDLWVVLETQRPGAGRRLLGAYADLHFSGRGIEKLERWHGLSAEYTKAGGRWLGLIRTDEGLHAMEGKTPKRVFAPLTREAWLASGTTFIPRDGGYTVLGTFGTYINLDETLERTDHLGLFARIGAHFAHFRRFAWYNDTWLDYAPLKMATLPILLFGLPLFLLPGLIRRRRPSARAAALWLVLALCFAWHFWYFTGARWF